MVILIKKKNLEIVGSIFMNEATFVFLTLLQLWILRSLLLSIREMRR